MADVEESTDCSADGVRVCDGWSFSAVECGAG